MLEAFHVLSRLWILQNSLFDGGIVGIHRERHLEARLAIETDGEVDGVFFQVFLVAHWPLCIADSGVVSECLPKFFCNVRAEWSQQHNKVLQHFLARALHLVQLVQANHEGRDRGVIREVLNVLRNFLDELVDGLQLFLRAFWVVATQFAFLVESEHPQFLQEAVATVDSVGVPRLACLHRTEEHFIKTKGVGTETLHNHIWVHHVEHGFRHLLNGPATNVLAIFEDELCRLIFWSPSLECLHVEHIVLHDVHIHVDRCHVIFLAEVVAHKGVRVLDAIHKIRTTLNHTLVDELLEWFFLAAVAVVVKHFVPETAVDEVSRCMFRTTHIEVNVLPVSICLLAHEGCLVVRVHVAEVVSRTTRKSWHGVEFDWEHRHVVNLRVLHHLLVLLVPSPLRSVAEWRFTRFGREELIHFWQEQRQALRWNHLRDAVLVIHREWLTPITLTREDGIAQAVVHLHASQLVGFHVFLRGSDGFLDGQAIEGEINIWSHAWTWTVHHNTFLRIVALFAHVGTLDEWNDRKVEVLGKGIVARVVSRNSHDSTRSITCQHVVAHPDWVLLASEWVDGIAAREHTRHLLVNHALAFRALLHLFQIGIHLRLLLRRSQFCHEFALWSQHHERHSEHRICTGGEDGEMLVGVSHIELHFRSFRATNPVALGFLQTLCPLNRVESVEQTLRVGTHTEAPLAHLLLHNRITASHRHTINNLIIGKHRAKLRAPVHHRLAQESNAPVHQRVALLLLVHCVPFSSRQREFFRTSGIQSLRTFLFEVLHQLVDRLSLLQVVVVVAFVHELESPLRPVIVVRVAGAHFAVPVEAETNLVELFAIVVDILESSDFRMLTCLDGILLCWQSVGIVAHWVQHIETLQTLVASIDVACYVSQRMSHVQSCARWIREHVQHIELLLVLVFNNVVSLLLHPALLPFLLNLFEIVFHIFYYNEFSTC